MTNITGDLMNALHRKLRELIRQGEQQKQIKFNTQQRDKVIELVIPLLQALNKTVQAIVEGKFDGAAQLLYNYAESVLPRIRETDMLPPSLIHAPDLIPEGWVPNLAIDAPLAEFDVNRLKPRSLRNEKHEPVCYAEMRRRIEACNGNRSFSDGKKLLAESHLIPREFWPFDILLPGTDFIDELGNHQTAYLRQVRGVWTLRFTWTGHWDLDRVVLACIE